MSDEERLESLMLQWRERRDRGEVATPQELCRDCPELARQLEERIRAAMWIDTLGKAPAALDATNDGALPHLGRSNVERVASGSPDDPYASYRASELAPNRASWSTHDGEDTLQWSGEKPPLRERVSVPGYEVHSELGRGGMGVVYKARQQKLNRFVALKLILSGTHAGEYELERFAREAETVARLKHPHVVDIYEFGVHEGKPYFSLELLEGGSLANRVRGEPQPPTEAARLVETLAVGVQAAHDQKIIHRDLKPGNILLSADGTPKITDFGLAKQCDSAMTATGDILGTPSYMAPEQAEGRTHEIGPAADVYALGAILYELLVGRPPFKGVSAWETVQMVIGREPVRPRQLQPSVPCDLETICLKCLRKDATQRYASATELAADLRRFQSGEPIHARPVGAVERGWMWMRRRPALAAFTGVSGVACLALLVLAFWFTATLGLERGKRTLAESQASTAVQLAQTREFYTLLSEIRERRATPSPGWTWHNLEAIAKAATLTPAADHGAELRSEAASALGAPDARLERTVAEGIQSQCLAFDPKGRFLAVGQGRAMGFVAGTVRLIDPGGAKPDLTLTFPPAVGQAVFARSQDGVRSLQFSPDGRWLVAGTAYGALQIWDLADDDRPRLARQAHQESVIGLGFSADSSALFTAGKDHLVKRWSVPTWEEAAQHKVGGAVSDLAVHPRFGWVSFTAPHPNGGDATWFLAGDTLQQVRPPDYRGGSLAFEPRGEWSVRTSGGHLDVMDSDIYSAMARPRHLSPTALPPDATIEHFALNSEGSLALTSSAATGPARLWDLASGHILLDLPGTTGAVWGAFDANAPQLAMSAARGVLVYALANRRVQQVHRTRARRVDAFALAPDGRRLATVFTCGRPEELVWLRLGDLDAGPTAPPESRELLAAYYYHLTPARIAFGPSGWLAVREEGSVTLWQDGLPRVRWPRSDDDPTLRHLAFSADNRLWSAEGTDVVARSVPDGKVTARWSSSAIRLLTGSAGPVSLAAGRSRVVAGGNNGYVYLLRAADAAQTAARSVSSRPVRCVALNAAETEAFAGTDAGELVALDATTGAIMTQVNGHRDKVTAMACSGSLVATGSHDRTIKVWQRDEGRLVELFALRISTPVRWLAFHPDGVRLCVLLEHDAAVRIWRLDELWRHFHELGIGLSPKELKASEPPPLPPVSVPAPIQVAPTGPHGLKAELFRDVDLRNLVKVRYDANIDVDWEGKPADPDLGSDEFSIRWTGWLKAPRPGLYKLESNSADGARIWLDGKCILDRWMGHHATFSTRVKLTDAPHELRVEYARWGRVGWCRLHWAEGEEAPLQPIPTSALFHDRAAANATPR